ncbi:MAG: LOG family protein [Planctomycetota bacterium]|jgi:uncharacterized protein (TIGR00730 family)
MKRVCVFCGSNAGRRPAFVEAAHELGRLLARRGLGVVFGAGGIGLMRELADAVLAEGGEIIGVIPHALVERELAHAGVTDLRVVDSMHERKALMVELADGFLALPGGYGTFEELLEIVTWAQLGLHRSPCGLLNVRGYFDRLLQFLDHAVEERFLKPEHRALLLVGNTPEDLLARFEAHVPPDVERWIERDET